MTTVKFKVDFGRVVKPVRKNRNRPEVKQIEKVDPLAVKTKGRPGSAAELLAVAYFVERGLNDGGIESFEVAAALVGVTRSRLSQIMKLLDLKPEEQEAVLLGNNRVAERGLRGVAGRVEW